MPGKMQVDSVKVSAPLPQDSTPAVTEENKKLIEINFKNEAAEEITQAGLPVMGLGVEIGHRLGEKAQNNLKEYAENYKAFEEKHPVLAKILVGPTIRNAIIAIDKWFE